MSELTYNQAMSKLKDLLNNSSNTMSIEKLENLANQVSISTVPLVKTRN